MKLVPSMRNAFSFTPEPNADTVFTVPLDGEVGDTPGAALMKSNMLNRREGIALSTPGRSESRRRCPALLCASRSSTTNDSSTPATLVPRPLDGRSRPDADVLFAIGAESLNFDFERGRPGGRAGKRNCPFSLVVWSALPIHRRRAHANKGSREDSALFVLDRPMRVPVHLLCRTIDVSLAGRTRWPLKTKQGKSTHDKTPFKICLSTSERARPGFFQHTIPFSSRPPE